jgi:hypothetical protein
VYNQTKQELAALYSKIFDGPTPAYPEDDQLEYQVQQAQNRCNEIQASLTRESHIVSLLQSANTALQACSSKIQQALKYSKWGTRCFPAPSIFVCIYLTSLILQI